MSVLLHILYHDDCLVAVNKPAGMLVHRSWLDTHETRFVMQTLRDQIGQYVYPLHRLDRPTSGVLLFALNPETARQMAVQFEQQRIEKHYLAVVRGWLLGEGRIDYALKEPLDKIADCMAEPDKAAQTAVSDYRCLGVAELPYACGPHPSSRFSLMRLSPLTGRKHQLRRHLKHVFHPILGDSNYGDKKQNRALAAYTGVRRLMLHAHSLVFTHPQAGGQVRVEAPTDAVWQQMEDILQFRLPE
ncbi:tRNA pseudouridine65 synthase [Neisseria sp. HSC-16F19]|nr:tRNA pseudouridine(65) synthase TruC [Neisseria sp. HSC-16F19]MCP2040891.1 tRNA pseudouridine65 synthase [Neisseria sp. HSC-16F19]